MPEIPPPRTPIPRQVIQSSDWLQASARPERKNNAREKINENLAELFTRSQEAGAPAGVYALQGAPDYAVSVHNNDIAAHQSQPLKGVGVATGETVTIDLRDGFFQVVTVDGSATLEFNYQDYQIETGIYPHGLLVLMFRCNYPDVVVTFGSSFWKVISRAMALVPGRDIGVVFFLNESDPVEIMRNSVGASA